MKCQHENYDDYFEVCTDCGADLEQIVQENFINELQTVYKKMQDVMGLSGDIEPMQLAQLDEQQTKLARIVADWLISNLNKEE